MELSHPNAELRLLEVFYHKIYKVLDNLHVNAFFEQNYILLPIIILEDKSVVTPVKRTPAPCAMARIRT